MSSKSKKDSSPTKEDLTKPWISMRTGIIVILITSIVMMVFTSWQAVPVIGWKDGILTSLLYGGMIWIVFLIMLLVFRFLRR